MFVISNENQAQGSHQVFSIHKSWRNTNFTESQGFWDDADAQVLGKAGPGLYQRMLVRGTNKAQ